MQWNKLFSITTQTEPSPCSDWELHLSGHTFRLSFTRKGTLFSTNTNALLQSFQNMEELNWSFTIITVLRRAFLSDKEVYAERVPPTYWTLEWANRKWPSWLIWHEEEGQRNQSATAATTRRSGTCADEDLVPRKASKKFTWNSSQYTARSANLSR